MPRPYGGSLHRRIQINIIAPPSLDNGTGVHLNLHRYEPSLSLGRDVEHAVTLAADFVEIRWLHALAAGIVIANEL
jgi:hypothetical protein